MSKVGARQGINTDRQHDFAQGPSANIQRSSFNRSSSLTTTFDSGFLVPIFVDEALPGDTMTMQVSTFVRMATPLHPIFSGQTLDLFFFSVPNRLLWDNWKKMMGEQEDPGDSIVFLVPTVGDSGSGYVEKSLFDYMGLPIDVTGVNPTALAPRAYNLIWNEWFRDQNLQDSAPKNMDDGPDGAIDYPLRRRGKRHDYFTSCLPFPQKGDAVEIPLGGTIPIVPDGTVPTYEAGASGISSMDGTPMANAALGTVPGVSFGNFGAGTYPDLEFVNSGLEGDLSSATTITVNQLRESITLQQLLERDARGGTRYTELIRSHFGVSTPDMRQQRPEFLGGGSMRISVNPVAATTEGTSQDLGDLAAYITGAATNRGFTHSFTEHCVVLGFACVRADMTYQQFKHRLWSRREKYDFYFPTLANLGEQAVLNQELFSQGSAGGSDDTDVFGYQEAWAEYRYKPSMVTGLMRSAASAPLDTWHLAYEFSSLPLLNDTFIEENPPVNRVLAVSNEPQWLFDAWFQLTHVRPMPVRSRPGLKRF